MRFSIDYRTEYRYAEPVTEQHNALRVRPADTVTQRCEAFEVEVEPDARLYWQTDYFGTPVVEFNVPARHDRLLIQVRARVHTNPLPLPREAGFEALREQDYWGGVEEYLVAGSGVARNGRMDELLEAVAGDTPLAVLRRVCELIPDRFEYRQGVTYVGSTVEDLLEGGAGVCQDFVHLGLLLLRRRGIAARYVSGYLYAPPEDDESASAEVETHAWLEALLPEAGPDGGHAWVGADPTNRKLATEEHVKIGHGRHYSDVPPIKGVYRGGAASELDAAVRMTRIDNS